MTEALFVAATIVYFAAAFVFMRMTPLTGDRLGRALFALKAFGAFALACDAYAHDPRGAWIWAGYALVTAAWRLRGIRAALAAGVAPRGVAKMMRGATTTAP